MASKKQVSKKDLETLKNYLKQKAEDTPELLFDIEKILFKEQLEFVKSNSRKTVACCSRRAGKSIALCAALIDSSIRHSGRLNLYITLSKTSARNIIWADLVKMSQANNLDVKFNHHEMIASFWNGSKILIGGAKDTTEIEKYRGIKAQLIVLDEAQSFKPFMHELVQDILEPALGDYQGKMMVTGTPNPTCKGFFYAAHTNQKGFTDWESHHWTLKDNIMFPAFVDGLTSYDKLIDEVLTGRGVNHTNPAFRREYLGEWAQDNDALVYDCPDTGRVTSLEEGHDWEYILAYDTGFRDADAFSVIAYSLTCKTAYVVETRALENSVDEEGNEVKRGFSEAMEVIRELNNTYKFRKIVFDPTESGLKITEEIRRRYGIRMEPAEKSNKQAYIAFLNDDLRTGRLKVVEASCENLLFQWDNLVWKYFADGTRKPGTMIQDKKWDHESDATLYAWRAAKHFMAKEPQVLPEVGTEAYGRMVQRQLFEEALKESKKAIQDSMRKKKSRVSVF